jgi:hypothetical protein
MKRSFHLPKPPKNIKGAVRTFKTLKSLVESFEDKPPPKPRDRFEDKLPQRKFERFKSTFDEFSSTVGHEQVIDVDGAKVAIQGFPPPQNDPTGILQACHDAIMEEIVAAAKEELEDQEDATTKSENRPTRGGPRPRTKSRP